MLDRKVRTLIDPALDRIGVGLARIGIGADTLTLIGFAAGIAAALAIAAGQIAMAAILFAANRVLDGLDGSVARATQMTPRGGFLDIMSDFCVYGAIVLAFACLAPSQNALSAATLLFCFYINGASFLAYAALQASHVGNVVGATRKSIHYSSGLMEGTETILFFAAMMAWPNWFAALAWVFAALTFLTTLFRCNLAWTTFRRSD